MRGSSLNGTRRPPTMLQRPAFHFPQKNLAILGSLLTTLAVLLGGCFFSHSEHFDADALVHQADESKHVVEIRQTVRDRGNMHIPFDFTVYEYDRTYEIRLKSLDGLTEAKDLELWLCGRRLTNATGTVRILREALSVALDVPASGSAGSRPMQLRGDFRLTPGFGPLRPCAHRKG